MLTQAQINTVWQSKMEAEARACYFADLASRESTIKRWITGISFFLSSATVVTLLSEAPKLVSVLLSIPVALANAYTIGINQDSKIKTLSKLHIQWLALEHDYDRLWSHLYDDEAERSLDQHREREHELSEEAATQVGHDEARWSKWLDMIYKKHETTGHARTERETQ